MIILIQNSALFLDMEKSRSNSNTIKNDGLWSHEAFSHFRFLKRDLTARSEAAVYFT